MFKTYPILFLWTLPISTKNNKLNKFQEVWSTQRNVESASFWTGAACTIVNSYCGSVPLQEIFATHSWHVSVQKKIPKNECFVIFPRYSIATCSLGSSSTNCKIAKNKPCCSWCGPFLSLEIYISHPKQSFNLFRNISNAFLRSHEASCHLSLLSLTAHCVDYSDWLFARI